MSGVYQPVVLDFKEVIMRKFMLVVLAVVMVAAAYAGQSLVDARMKTIIFDKLEFRSIPFDEIVTYLRDMSKELDQQKRGVSIVLKLDKSRNPKLTLSLGKTTLYTALATVVDMADYRKRYIGNTVILEPIPKKK
jgi:hypothetical protein